MSAPVLWILAPLFFSGILYLLRRWDRAILAAGIAAALFLAWLAWQLPIEKPPPWIDWPGVPFALQSREISASMFILGRQLVISDQARPVLLFFYLGLAFWLGGAFLVKVDRVFPALALAMTALLIAALSVEPFIYAGLLIEMAVLVCIPLLTTPGKPVGAGILRFLIFQTLSIPFLVTAGWLLGGSQAPGSAQQLLQVAFLIGLGFAFLAGVFPFHTWLPMVMAESNPYMGAFVLFWLPGGASLFALSFFSEYPWIWTAPTVMTSLQTVGVLMVVLGGVWAAFQRNLGRILGFGVVCETGLAMLAISLGPGEGALPALSSKLFFMLLLPRLVSLALWGLALSKIFEEVGDLRFRTVHGVGHKLPVAAISLLLAQFSLGGFPLLASFPVQIGLWTALAERSSFIVLFALIGLAGLFASGLRSMAVLVMGPSEHWQFSEDWLQAGLFSIGWVLLFLIGLASHWFMPLMAHLVAF